MVNDCDYTKGCCTACGKDKDVRWKNLYTIGSEGTWMCHPCEMTVTRFVRDLMREAAIERKEAAKQRIAERREAAE